LDLPGLLVHETKWNVTTTNYLVLPSMV